MQDYRELGQLGGLNADGPESYPTVRGMGFVEEKGADEHKQYDTYRGEHHGGFPQLAIVRAHQRKHPSQADNEPGGLPQEKNVGAAVLVFRGDGRRAENHHRAEHAQRQRDTE